MAFEFVAILIILTRLDVSSQQCTHGDVRLVGGSVPNEGRVEVCVHSVWGTVCDDGWDFQDAMVVCGQLGYTRNGAVAYSSAHFGQGTGSIVLDDVECNLLDHRLLDCPRRGSGHNCALDHSEDAGVFCCVESCDCTHGDVRLVGGPDSVPNEGRVEVCANSVWGTVCDDGWDVQEAMVVCGQLGYGRNGARAFRDANFGQGTGPITLDDVLCNPSSNRELFECSHLGFYVENCGHHEDAGVSCILNRVDGTLSATPWPVNVLNTTYSAIVLLTWEQTSEEGDRPVSFRVECKSQFHNSSVTLSVTDGRSFTTLIGGLLQSTLYNCCVSAVYDTMHTSEGACTLVGTIQANITTGQSPVTEASECISNSNLQPLMIGGVLGFAIIVLLIVLVIMGMALGCVLRAKAKLCTRQDIPPQRKSNHQVNADTASTQPGAAPQAVRYTNTVKETAHNYINFEAGYEPVEYGEEENGDTFNNVYELDEDDAQPYEVSLEEEHYKVPRSIARW